MRSYAHPVFSKALVQILNTFPPLALIIYLMKLSLAYPYWITLLLALPASGLFIRSFIIQHDCGHGSFFASRRWNDRLGSVLGVFTLMPYRFWLKEHAAHHASSGNLDQRGRGDILTLTVREYIARGPFGRLSYRIYRNPIVMFLIGAPFYFAFLHRYPYFIPKDQKDSWRSIHACNIALATVFIAGCWLLGVKQFFMIYVPVIYFASVFGAWFFFVQHQFEGAYWVRERDWKFKEAAVLSSTYYDLPPLLHWFSGNIGFHHIHHLESRIPNYRLPECYAAHPELQKVNRLTILQSLRCPAFALWDEDAGALVSFRALRRCAYLPRATA